MRLFLRSCALLLLAVSASTSLSDTQSAGSSTGSTVTARAAPTAASESWQPHPFARYEEIIGRAPFGKPPPAPPPVVLPVAPPPPPPAFVNQLVLCAINRRPDGKVAVGFMDNGQKPPRSYYLDVGDKNGDGYKAVSADYEQATATISKDGTEVPLKMGQNAAPAGPVTAPPAAPVPTTVPAVPVAAMPALSIIPAPSPMPSAMRAPPPSYAARLSALRGRVPLTALAHPEAKERLAQKMREYNLSLIRQGQQPAGSITLTPEEDAQLVKEGVLPAQH